MMRRAPALVLAAALVAVACSGSSQKIDQGAAPAPDPKPDVPEVPREVLERDLAATVMENYSHLTLGNFSAFRDGLAPEAPVVLIGVTPDDVVVGKHPTEAARDRRLYRVLGPTLLSKNLDIHLSDDGSIGWTFDEVSYRVPYSGRTASIPVRNTSLYVRDFDRWVLVMEHESFALAIDDLRTMAAVGELDEPRRFGSRTRAPPSRELVALVGRLHNAGPDAGERPISGSAGTLVLFPDRDHELRGADAVQGPSLAGLFGPTTTVGLRDYRIDLGKNGSVAWMAANLVVRTEVNEDPVDFGLRGTYVFVNTDRGWQVVQMHVSAAVAERELSRRVFDTP